MYQNVPVLQLAVVQLRQLEIVNPDATPSAIKAAVQVPVYVYQETYMNK